MSYIKEMEKEVLNFHEKKILPQFTKHALTVSGFSGAGILQILNRCVSKIPDDLIYLEIGTNRGKTLTGASLGNRKKMVGVDNFSIDFGSNVQSIKSELYKNLTLYSSHCDVSIFPMGYVEFIDAMKGFYSKKVAVYFYDGAHDLPDQKDHFWHIKPLLADEALVLIDDTLSDDKKPPYCCARWATKEIAEKDEEYSIIRDFQKNPSTPSDTMGIWNGLMVLKFSRKENYIFPNFKTKFEESIDQVKETYQKLLSDGVKPRQDGGIYYNREWIYENGYVVEL